MAGYFGVDYASNTITDSSSANAIWGTWTMGSDSSTASDATPGSIWFAWAGSATVAEPTQEEIEAREERRLEVKRLKEVADQKALNLLMDFLEEEQLSQLESEGAFVVKTKERE